jgi:prepilin-type N-terminal cleavage/methylation domain-containing protein
MKDRSGFTLIELLVVIAILLIVAVMTAGVVNILTDGDDVRAGARQIQSMLEGARDRAIYAKAPRGVRFITRGGTTSEDTRICREMVYIEPTKPWVEGIIQLERLDADNDGTPDSSTANDPISSTQAVIVRDIGWPSSPGTRWVELYRRKLLNGDLRIKIPNDDSGTWYPVVARSPFPQTLATDRLRGATVAGVGDGNLVATTPLRLRLLVPYIVPANTPASQVAAFNSGSGPLTYKLELSPSEVPNQVPVKLPRNVVIHLDRCSSDPNTIARLGDRLPSAWRISQQPPGYPHTYSENLDILFSPRGNVEGAAASAGILHLYVATQKDADRDHTDWERATFLSPVTVPEYGPRNPAGTSDDDTYERGEKAFVSIFTRSGAVSTHRVDAVDRFKYAEIGEVAGK